VARVEELNGAVKQIEQAMRNATSFAPLKEELRWVILALRQRAETFVKLAREMQEKAAAERAAKKEKGQ
jgi:hypothetical protein